MEHDASCFLCLKNRWWSVAGDLRDFRQGSIDWVIRRKSLRRSLQYKIAENLLNHRLALRPSMDDLLLSICQHAGFSLCSPNKQASNLTNQSSSCCEMHGPGEKILIFQSLFCFGSKFLLKDLFYPFRSKGKSFSFQQKKINEKDCCAALDWDFNLLPKHEKNTYRKGSLPSI